MLNIKEQKSQKLQIRISMSHALGLCLLLLMPLWAQAQSESTPGYLSPQGQSDNPEDRNLTDYERWMQDNYVHQGYIQRTFQEKCDAGDSDMQDACRGIEADSKYLGMDAGMVKGLGQMYGMVLGVMPGTFKRDKVDPDGNPVTQDGDPIAVNEEGEFVDPEAEQGQEDMQDYCRYIAAGTEAAGMAFQTMGQNQINKTPMTEGNEQAASLRRVARAHKQRSDSAKLQGVGWGAATACYTAMLARPNISVGWQGAVKLTASAVLTGFWWDQVGFHSDHADKINSLADKLPGAGDCTPVDDLDCYCAQPETMYDPEYCLPEGYANRTLADASIAVSCIDDKMENDPHCKCERTNTCLDRKTTYHLNGLDIGSSMGLGANSPFSQMMRGELVEGRLDGGRIEQQQRAMADRALRKVGQLDIGPDRNLTSDEQKIARSLQNMGVPGNMAAKLATMPPSERSAFESLAGLPGSGGAAGHWQSSGNNSDVDSRVMRFGGGRGLSNPRRSRGSNNNTDNPFKDLLRQQEEQQEDPDRVLVFQQRAVANQNAQISNRPEYSVFDIISNRYRLSAWRRLDLDE